MKKYTMSPAALITTILVIALGTVDLVIVLTNGTGSSVSNFLINAGMASPVFVFAFGYVAGHLTGYMRPEKETK